MQMHSDGCVHCIVVSLDLIDIVLCEFHLNGERLAMHFHRGAILKVIFKNGNIQSSRCHYHFQAAHSSFGRLLH